MKNTDKKARVLDIEKGEVWGRDLKRMKLKQEIRKQETKEERNIEK